MSEQPKIQDPEIKKILANPKLKGRDKAAAVAKHIKERK